MKQILKAELDVHLPYEYDENPLTFNARNTSSKKLLNNPMDI